MLSLDKTIKKLQKIIKKGRTPEKIVKEKDIIPDKRNSFNCIVYFDFINTTIEI